MIDALRGSCAVLYPASELLETIVIVKIYMETSVSRMLLETYRLPIGVQDITLFKSGYLPACTPGN